MTEWKAEFATIEVEPDISESIEEYDLGSVKKTNGRTIVKIKNPDVMNVYELNEEIFERLLDLFFVRNIPFLREDIIPEESLIINEQVLLREVRPYFRGEDYGALSYASYIIKQEDKGKDVMRLYKNLFSTYGGRGVRMYSLMRSPEISFLEKIYQMKMDGEDKKTISHYIDGMIENPDEIFVSRFWGKEELKGEIESRFLRGINEFPIFARSGKVGVAKRAIKEIKRENKNVVSEFKEPDWAENLEEEATTIDVHRFPLRLEYQAKSLLEKRKLEPLDMIELTKYKIEAKEMGDGILVKRFEKKEEEYFSNVPPQPEWFEEWIKERDVERGTEVLSLEEAEENIKRYLKAIEEVPIKIPEETIKMNIRRDLERIS